MSATQTKGKGRSREEKVYAKAERCASLEHGEHIEYLPENGHLKVLFHHVQFRFKIAETSDG